MVLVVRLHWGVRGLERYVHSLSSVYLIEKYINICVYVLFTDEWYLCRANYSVPRLRILMRRMLRLVRFVRRRRSKGGSIVSGVRIRRMVRFLSFYITIEG